MIAQAMLYLRRAMIATSGTGQGRSVDGQVIMERLMLCSDVKVEETRVLQ